MLSMPPFQSINEMTVLASISKRVCCCDDRNNDSDTQHLILYIVLVQIAKLIFFIYHNYRTAMDSTGTFT